jgi:hypothetical protein
MLKGYPIGPPLQTMRLRQIKSPTATFDTVIVAKWPCCRYPVHPLLTMNSVAKQVFTV